MIFTDLSSVFLTTSLYRSPSLILLDDLHSLSPTASASLSARLDDLHIKPSVRPVVVVATTNHIEAVDLALRRPGRFDREIEITTPSAVERREVRVCVCVHTWCVCVCVYGCVCVCSRHPLMMSATGDIPERCVTLRGGR